MKCLTYYSGQQKELNFVYNNTLTSVDDLWSANANYFAQ